MESKKIEMGVKFNEKSTFEYKSLLSVDSQFFTQSKRFQFKGLWNLLKEIIRHW